MPRTEDSRTDAPPLTFTAEAKIDIAARANGDSKNVGAEIIAYTGGEMAIGGFDVPVVIDMDGMELAPQINVIRDHDVRLNSLMGKGKPTIQNYILFVRAVLARGLPEVQQLIKLQEADVNPPVSIGAVVLESRQLKPGEKATINGREFTGPIYHIVRSRLREVSFVGMGADEGAYAQIAAQQKGSNPMPQSTKNPKEVTTDPALQERERVKGIRAAFRGIDSPEAQAECDRLIESGESVVEGEKSALKMFRASFPNVSNVRGVAGGGGDPRQALTADLAHLLGASGETIKAAGFPAPRERGPRSLMDACVEAIRIDGNEIPVSVDKTIIKAFSTDTFSGATSGAISVIGLEGFQSAEEPVMMIARREPLMDFKPALLARLNGNMPYRPLGQDGEIKSVDIDGDTTPIGLTTKAALARLTRQAVINDQRQQLAGIPRELGREAARCIGDAMAEALDDAGGNFFTEARGNLLTGSSSALSVDALTSAIKNLRTTKDNSGRVVNLAPRFLLVGADLEARARSIVNSTELGTSDGSPRGNPMANIAEVLVDARIPALTWYLISAPQNAAIVLATLNGMVSPNVEALPPEANTLGIGWRAWIDFGIALHEWRGIIKNTGE